MVLVCQEICLKETYDRKVSRSNERTAS